MNRVSDNNPSSSQQGGVCSLWVGDATWRVKSKVPDPLGRWIVNELYCGKNQKIVVINAYMPCLNSPPGPMTYQMQLFRAYNKTTVRYGNPQEVREHCFIDLTNLLHELRKEHQKIILCLDANSNANESQSMINKLRSVCGLVDVVHSFSPKLAQFPM